jgi:hypothetical protein
MDLTSYVDNLGREFTTLAETGGDEARALVEQLSASLASAIRLTLLEALSAAADEITLDLAPGSVELRLRGRDPNFVVTPPESGQPAEHEPETARSTSLPDADAFGADDSATMARINFRLPEQLKAAIEEAAGKEGRSVNTWLVRVATAALQQPPSRDHGSDRRGLRSAQRHTGWVS